MKQFAVWIFCGEIFLFASQVRGMNVSPVKCSLLLEAVSSSRMLIRYRIGEGSPVQRIRLRLNSPETLLEVPLVRRETNPISIATVRLIEPSDGEGTYSLGIVADANPLQVFHWDLGVTKSPDSSKELLRQQFSLSLIHTTELSEVLMGLGDSFRNAYRFGNTSVVHTLSVNIQTRDEFSRVPRSLRDSFGESLTSWEIDHFFDRIVVPDILTTPSQFEAIRALSESDLDSTALDAALPLIRHSEAIRTPHRDVVLRSFVIRLIQAITGEPFENFDSQSAQLLQSVDAEIGQVHFFLRVFRQHPALPEGLGVATMVELGGRYYQPNLLDNINPRGPSGSANLGGALQEMARDRVGRRTAILRAFAQ